MSALQVFTYASESEIRTLTIDGEVWFVAADVARVLGYRSAPDMTRRIDDQDKGYAKVRTLGGEQELSTLNEAGLYDAIFRSNAEGAKPFRHWVTREVLPEIRRTGGYKVPTGISFEEASDELVVAKALVIAQRQIDEAKAKVKELEAPANAWNSLSRAEGDFTVSDAAKILARDGISTGPRKLFDWLEANKWIFRRGGRWQAMQSAVNAGWIVERVTSGYYDERTGERKQAEPQIRVTPKGVEKLLELLQDQRKLALVEGGAS